MANDTPKDRRLTGYLLGQISEAERTEFEDRYFNDDALFESLAAVETELIDAYARGELPETDRVQFEKRLLRSPRFRARIALALQLHARAAAIVGGSVTGTQAPASAPRETSAPKPAVKASATRTTSPLVGALAGGVGLAAAVGGWWMFQSRNSPPTPVAQNNPAPVAVLPVPVPVRVPEPPLTADKLTVAPAGPVQLVLAPGSQGSHDSVAVFSKPAGSDVVRLQIDHDGAPRERYAVIVSTRSRQRIWTELNMAARAQGASGVILQIPADALPPGDYLVTLSGGALQVRRLDALADYTIRVR